ncbi:hypothetical protein PFISCL1PPCAC_19796, partial [Pristionchus fissidentatus]
SMTDEEELSTSDEVDSTFTTSESGTEEGFTMKIDDNGLVYLLSHEISPEAFRELLNRVDKDCINRSSPKFPFVSRRGNISISYVIDVESLLSLSDLSLDSLRPWTAQGRNAHTRSYPCVVNDDKSISLCKEQPGCFYLRSTRYIHPCSSSLVKIITKIVTANVPVGLCVISYISLADDIDIDRLIEDSQKFRKTISSKSRARIAESYMQGKCARRIIAE